MTASVIDIKTSAEGWNTPGVGGWTRLMLSIAPHMHRGSLTIQLPDGRRFRAAGHEPGRNATIVMKNERIAKRLLTGGNLSFAESYLDDDWSSPDLAELTEWACQNDRMDEIMMGKPWYRALRRIIFLFRSNTKSGSKRNISYHYDLGNDFYRQWLDPSMTYSAALYTKPGEQLEQAQANKYRRLVEVLNVQPDHQVLEIGSGWGGFACLAAKERGCTVHGITISKEQLEFAQRRAFEAGLNEKVTFELRDYRDLDRSYDRVASIEMFEAVGERYWPTYFGKLRDSLAPGGVAGLQVITIADKYFEAYRGTMDFIQRYVFPGGMLPSPSVLRQQTQNAGLIWQSEMCFGQHYADTLADWMRRFTAAWPTIQPLGFDDRFKRMWEYYLAYCEGGFRAGTIDVMQVALARD